MVLSWRDVPRGSPPLNYGQGADYSEPYYRGPIEGWCQPQELHAQGFQPNGGRSFAIAPFAETIFLIQDGWVEHIAGVHGASGYKDGPGKQARFRIGGMQGDLHGAAVDGKGRLYVTDTGNGKIRRLTEQADKTWNVETFANITCETLTIDADDNLWTAEWNILTKIDQAGQVAGRIGAPGKIVGIRRAAAGRVFFIVLDGSAVTIVYELFPATMTFKHHAGMTAAEVASFGGILAPGCPVDGPANRCSFYTAYFADVSADGKRIGLSSGDETRLIVVTEDAEGNVSSATLCSDGTVRPLNDRRSPERFVANNVSGAQANGLPYAYDFKWVNSGGKTIWKELYLDTSTPTPPPTGGNVQGFLDQIIDNRTAWGWAMEPGQDVGVEMRIDGVSVATVPTDVLRSDVNSALGVTGNHGFSWNIPEQFGDGQTHSLGCFVGGQQLSQSPQSFSFTVEAPPPPPPPPDPEPEPEPPPAPAPKIRKARLRLPPSFPIEFLAEDGTVEEIAITDVLIEPAE